MSVQVPSPSALLPQIFKPGRAITEGEVKSLGNHEAPISEVIDHGKTRGVLTLQEAQDQVQAYIDNIPADRKEPFQNLVGQGIKFARENKIDAFSGIGITLGTSKEATPAEKIIGLDLYISQQLEMERRRSGGRARAGLNEDRLA